MVRMHEDSRSAFRRVTLSIGFSRPRESEVTHRSMLEVEGSKRIVSSRGRRRAHSALLIALRRLDQL
jgi:hypothetical protein